MKKFTLLFCIPFAMAMHAYSQETPDYQRFSFSLDNTTYTPLTEGAEEVYFEPDSEETDDWDDTYSDPISLPFQFYYQNVLVNSIMIDTYGGLMLNEIESGFPYANIAGLNMDYAQIDGRGDVFYETVGEEGTRIFKVEFRNVGTNLNTTGNDTANFQIWLHEGTNAIEYVAGYCNIPSDIFARNFDDLMDGKDFLVSGLVSNEGDVISDFDGETYFHFVKINESTYEDSLAPSIFMEEEETGMPLLEHILISFPESGTIFRFLPLEDEEEVSIDKQNWLNAQVSPNPAKDVLHLTLNESNTKDATYQIFDLSGRLVAQDKITNQNTSINIQDITGGTYIIHVKTPSKEGTVKFTKL